MSVGVVILSGMVNELPPARGRHGVVPCSQAMRTGPSSGIIQFRAGRAPPPERLADVRSDPQKRLITLCNDKLVQSYASTRNGYFLYGNQDAP
jgi:hypothetical protein